MGYFDNMDAPCARCPHVKSWHIIGADEDEDSPDCEPHDSFCLECDDDDSKAHEWAPTV